MNVPNALPADQTANLRGFADALDLVVRLHDREADAALISGLRANPLADGFAGILPLDPLKSFDDAIASYPDPLPADVLDDMAAEYADIYVTHGYRASPNGSVWLTEDRIERQEPMFIARAWYDRYQMKVPNWSVRAEDHLVHELQFVSHLLRLATPRTAADAARFMDTNLLPWLSQFADRAMVNCRHRYHAASLDLTVALCEALRDRLGAITSIDRPAPLQSGQQSPAVLPVEPAYVPGLAESW